MRAPAARATLAAWDRATRLFHQLRVVSGGMRSDVYVAVRDELVSAEYDWLRWSGAACCPSDTAHSGKRGSR